jgi:hypothetical protein
MPVRITSQRSNRIVRAVVAALVLALALLPAGLAHPALAAPAAAGQRLPFKGNLDAQEIGVFNPGPPVVVSVIADGSGNGTRLGRFTYHYTVDIYPNPDGSAIGTTYYDFKAANGDHLYSIGDGVGDPVGHVVEQHTITGGTGRFAGATGQFTIDRRISLVTSITHGTFDGYIVLAH